MQKASSLVGIGGGACIDHILSPPGRTAPYKCLLFLADAVLARGNTCMSDRSVITHHSASLPDFCCCCCLQVSLVSVLLYVESWPTAESCVTSDLYSIHFVFRHGESFFFPGRRKHPRSKVEAHEAKSRNIQRRLIIETAERRR